MPGGLCVVHLVRAGEPASSVRRFLRSYAGNPAGADHRLVLLYKGFEDETALAPYRGAAEEVPHEEVHVSDAGFDLTAYRAGAEALRAERYCFLNSHSEILAGRWLELLSGALDRPGVGVAGATGSWTSHASLARLLLRLPSPYGGLIGSPADVTRVLAEMEGSAPPTESAEAPGRRSPARRALDVLSGLPHALRSMASFPAFPNRHLRTNAFVIDHAVLAGLTGFALRTKFDAHKLESGRAGITRQLEAAGLRAVVVDGFGGVWEDERWPASETLYQGEQGGLIVADNQTRAYAEGDDERRLLLSRCAWGRLAAPALRAAG